MCSTDIAEKLWKMAGFPGLVLATKYHGTSVQALSSHFLKTSYCVALEPGDILLAFSDGLPECWSVRDGLIPDISQVVCNVG